MEIVSEAINQYCLDHSTRPSKICEELEAFTLSSVPNPRMLSGPLVGSFLGTMITTVGARRVIEVGTYTGYSALAMAEHLPAEGELITLDLNADTQAVGRKYWERSPHGKKIRALAGDAAQLLAEQKGPFDFAFIDADKGGYLKYLRAILPMLSPNGVIVADNCLWSGRVLDQNADGDTKAIQQFNDAVASDPMLQSTLVPIRDGLHLIRKKRS